MTASAGGGFTHNDLNAIQDQVLRATGILNTDLNTEILEKLGLNSGATARRGVSAVDGFESTASTVYTTLATPDRVTDIVVPTDGILRIGFRALWYLGAPFAVNLGFAAIFIDGVQLQKHGANGYQAQEATFFGGTTATVFCRLHSSAEGIQTTNNQLGGATIALPQAVPSTGNVGGELLVRVPAGTYTVEVKYKDVSGTHGVGVQSRRLWVVGHGL